MLDAVVAAWYTALTTGKAWHASDVDRLDEGFNVLMTRTQQWPAPKQFLECVPARQAMRNYQPENITRALPAPTPALTLTPRTTDNARIQREIDKIAHLLHVDLSPDAEPERPDYRQAPDRPWGVDLSDWDAARGEVAPQAEHHDDE